MAKQTTVFRKKSVLGVINNLEKAYLIRDLKGVLGSYRGKVSGASTVVLLC